MEPFKPKTPQYSGNGWEIFQNRSIGFSFQYPQGWQSTFRDGGLVLNPPSGNKGYLAITMLVASSGSSSESPAEMYRGFLAMQSGNFQGYQRLWEKPIKLSSGHEALEYAFDFTDPHGPFRSIAVIAIRRGQQDEFFSLDVSGLRVEIKLGEEKFRNIVKSLTLR
ncbi:MAG: hypothetical protein JW730_12350 [Anaerolineales bacterium]|nr:hypothetical protein [Anaerolineales bacterium]